jgi:hypothetical protein
MQQTVFWDSTHQLSDTALQVMTVKISVAAPLIIHLVKQGKPLHHGKSVHTILKDCLLHPTGTYQNNGNGALTSVGSMWSVLKCAYVVVIISQPVFQASPSHF